MSTPAKISVLLLLTLGAFVAGKVSNQRPTEAATTTAARQVLYWTCPMHPQYKSDHRGECPSCGMRLEPVYAGGGNRTGAAAGDEPGMVQVSAAKQQMIGVRTDVVHRAPLSTVLRAPGRVVVDEARQYRIIAANDGWIRELGSSPAGAFVKKDEVLASCYVRDLVSTQQTYLYAFDINSQSEQAPTTNPLQRTSAGVNLRQALDALRSLGMADLQIEELRRTHNSASELRIYSPVTGFVLTRNISPAQRFDKGAELYRIADISSVWVMAEIFEKDRELVKPGSTATVLYRGREFPARMSNVLPQFDAQSRTLKTRFELDNPGQVLRPDMFVDVTIHVSLPAAVTVPADAVIDSGLRKTVYVDGGSGFFAPRLIQTGWRLGDRVQITKGLEPGERIVVAGNFLIDSESRMKQAASAAPVTAEPAVAKDPVCGMDVDLKNPQALKFQHDGKTYFFCSAKCKKDFAAAPARHLPNNQVVIGNGGGRGA